MQAKPLERQKEQVLGPASWNNSQKSQNRAPWTATIGSKKLLIFNILVSGHAGCGSIKWSLCCRKVSSLQDYTCHQQQPQVTRVWFYISFPNLTSVPPIGRNRSAPRTLAARESRKILLGFPASPN